MAPAKRPPPLRIYRYDGAKLPPDSVTGGGQGGLIWIGTKGRLPQSRGQFPGRQPVPYTVPPPKLASPLRAISVTSVSFTEACQSANVALRLGHRIEWEPLAFRVTNCREANQ